ncbi:hypothetical protein [Demequina sp.]|uniref:hypothetical protein n=1 Tax=Demequina sp. TaxID=2050685 RepID=UPI003D13515D
MRFTRAALVGAALITVTLTACAPPGQDGAPGVAATYEDVTVTNANIDQIYQAWLDDTKGTDVANRRQILTIELLKEDLLAKCKELGYPVTWSLAESQADQWIAFKGQQGEPSDDMIAATQGILALYVVVNVDPTFETLTEISDKVEAEADVSPRSGDYSTSTLIASVQAAMQSAENQQLGTQFSFVEYQNVNAFADTERPWFDRGTSAS